MSEAKREEMAEEATIFWPTAAWIGTLNCWRGMSSLSLRVRALPVECAAPGQRLSVDTWDGERGAMVAETPFLAKRQQAAPASA